jgi:hypothetical protein
VNPWAAEDPGQPEVTGKIASGFNLDNNSKTGGFVAEDGEQGIDHALYRAWGCDAPWRGDGNGTLHLRANDKMQGGLYTMVIRVSGNKDPMRCHTGAGKPVHRFGPDGSGVFPRTGADGAAVGIDHRPPGR